MRIDDNNNDIPWYLQDLISKEDASSSSSLISNAHNTKNENENSNEHNNQQHQKTPIEQKEYYHDVLLYWNPNHKNNKLQFQPFVGNDDDLKEILETYNTKYQTKKMKMSMNTRHNNNNDDYSDHVFFGQYQSLYIMIFVFGAMSCMILFIWVLHHHQYSCKSSRFVQHKRPHKHSSGGSVVNTSTSKNATDIQSDENNDHNIDPDDNIDSGNSRPDKTRLSQQSTIRPIENENDKNNIVTSTNNSLESNLEPSCYHHQHTTTIQNNHQGTPTAIMNNQNMNLTKIFLHDIPVMADMVSLSGLNRQESIKLVTKEVLETDRRHTEVSSFLLDLRFIIIIFSMLCRVE